jgi:hypothetical protein
VTLVRPGAWWIFLPALAGGVALGLTLVLLRRRGILQGSGGTSRTLLRD